jgi:glyoxylase I family protein
MTHPLFDAIHHVAIIASDYARSRHFYHQVLGLPIIAETLREERQSWKLDLALPDGSQLELFSFRRRRRAPPGRRRAVAPPGVSGGGSRPGHRPPEQHGVEVEPVRVDELTGKRFTFFADPDGLPLELYEAAR